MAKVDIKIVGYGWVGKAQKQLFPDAKIHDPNHGFVCEEPAKISFVCVPTPLKDGKLDDSIVREVVENSKDDLVVIRSTVMPGFCDSLKNRVKVCFVPEYLGETVAHPLLDPKTRPFLIIGGAPWNRQRVIEAYQSCYNANVSIRQVTCYEAEVIKLSENRAIAFKVAECQELYDACIHAGVDYYTIRDAVYGDDPRFNLWWTFIFPEKRGFNSKCIPKDVYGWAAWAESVGYDPEITKAILERNEKWLAQNK